MGQKCIHFNYIYLKLNFSKGEVLKGYTKGLHGKRFWQTYLSIGDSKDGVKEQEITFLRMMANGKALQERTMRWE